jgi:Glyoxalase/Bleomycin resistance protein/Dioxygenase superfamily
VFDGPVQLAYAVPDVRDAAAAWVERGVGPFFVLDHIDVHNVRVRGGPGSFDHSSAYGWWGPVMVELICQHDGGPDPVVPDSGLHHVAFFVDEFAEAASTLEADGRTEVLYAETGTGMPFAFHDATSTLGHFVEIYEPIERIRRFYDMVRTAGQDWHGSDPIRVL